MTSKKIDNKRTPGLPINHKQKLIEYYDNIPILRSVDYNIVSKQTKKIERNLILKALSIGQFEADLQKTRHVLSVNEIISILKIQFDFQTATSNVYYHMKKLTEIGLLLKVSTITLGNISTSYYGKISKLIWYRDFETIEDHSHFTDDGLDIMLNRMDKNLNSEDIKQIKAKLKKLDRYYHNDFMLWVQENEQYLEGLELNFLQELSDLFNKINYYTFEMAELFDQLARSMRIERLK